jgi:pyridoxamine 5'-phosphate oxidase
MKEDISNLRKVYDKGEIIYTKSKNPFTLFESWFNEAKDDRLIEEVNTMILSTIGIDGYPKGRAVLLKKISLDGFVFFSNYQSEKGLSIKKNNKVSLTFFWPSQERQIIIKGNVEKTSTELSDKYFSKRPFKSQISAIISKQSQIIDSYEKLKDDMNILVKKYKNKSPERPRNWGGYIVKPFNFEFWQGRPDRLHQRVLFYYDQTKWKSNKLSP